MQREGGARVNKRQRKKQSKIEKAASEKVINGDSLTTKERVAFNRYMEGWLGLHTVRQIKTLFGGA